MKHLLYSSLVVLLILSCSKDKSTEPTNDNNVVVQPPTGGGGGGGGSLPVKFSYVRDGQLIEHTDENAVNHNEPTNKYVNAFSSKDSTHNGLIISSVNIEIGIYGFQMDEIVIGQEYYFDDPNIASNYAYIDYSVSVVSGGGSTSYSTDDTSQGFVKITNINLVDSTFSGEYEGVLWEDPFYGNGWTIIESGTFTDVKFQNLN